MRFPLPRTDVSIRAFPVSLGWAGLGAATARAEDALGSPHYASAVLSGLAGALLVALVLLYGLKVLRAPSAVADELRPASGKASASSAACAALILSGLPLIPAALRLPLWLTGTTVLSIIVLRMLRQWLFGGRRDGEGWDLRCLIPMTGLMMVAAQGTGLAPSYALWLFFGIGAAFWLGFLSRFLCAFDYDKSLEGEKLPTLFITVSPPSVAFVAQVELFGAPGNPALVLLYFAALMAAVATAIHLHTAVTRFSLVWWSTAFPLAALTIASFELCEHRTGPASFYLSLGLLALLCTLTAILTVRTVLAATRRRSPAVGISLSVPGARDLPGLP